MIKPIVHVKKILLIEDRKEYYDPIKRWFEDEEYHVTLAKTYQAAIQAISEQHYHLAVVDLQLDADDVDNLDGLKLLSEIENRKLNKIMPCIVLSADITGKTILKAYEEGRIAHYITKAPGYRSELLTVVARLFAERVNINFNLLYDAGSGALVWEIAEDVNWSMSIKPDMGMLVAQLLDLFGKLFSNALRVHIAKLKPGLTGAAIIRVQPTWRHGLGTQYVAKIGRDDKIRTEFERYSTYVDRFLPPNTIAQIKDVVYSKHVGALLYTFAENDMVPLKEFDEFYEQNDAKVIVDSLRNLFEKTCRFWYDNRELKIEDVQALYYDAFRLDEPKLIERIQVVLPQFDPNEETFRFDHLPLEALNPIAWLKKYRSECVLRLHRCTTHGDLTGRNIMVDQTGKCWLIDFYRTYNSHILRDFVILETDIKYRLMKEIRLEAFRQFEEALLLTDDSGRKDTTMLTMSSSTRKGAQVVTMLRSTAYEFVGGGMSSRYQESRREYLLSLLMTTLNVVRLRHIPETRKFQAMLSASLICVELDKVRGRTPVYPKMDKGYVMKRGVTAVSFSAQQQFLAKKLDAQNLFLVLGSVMPPNANAQRLLVQIAALNWQMIYTTNQKQQLESAFKIYEDVLNRMPSKQPLTDKQPSARNIPIYALNSLLDDALNADNADKTDHESEQSDLHRQQLIMQMQMALQQGQSLLLLCATESELERVHKICYSSNMSGKIWVSGENIPEEVQDVYRKDGWRVLADAPNELLDSFAELKE